MNKFYKNFIDRENDENFLFLELNSLGRTLIELSKKLTLNNEIVDKIVIVRDKIVELRKGK